MLKNVKFKPAVRYGYKNGKFTVTEDAAIRQRFSEYGKILPKCTSLYLPERNDELAKRIFIEHMEERVTKANEELNRAKEQLRILKEEI